MARSSLRRGSQPDYLLAEYSPVNIAGTLPMATDNKVKESKAKRKHGVLHLEGLVSQNGCGQMARWVFLTAASGSLARARAFLAALLSGDHLLLKGIA